MMSGLEEISKGELYIGDDLVNDVEPKDRDIAMVFQNYALYPHMTVYQNMAFALKLKGYEKAEIDKRVKEAAEILSTYEEEKIDVRTKGQVAQIGPLSEGVYLIEGIPKDGYEIPAALISIPQWDAGEEKLSYHVTVIPKIQQLVHSVDTGDTVNLLPLSVLCLLSLGVVVGVSGRAYFLKDR